METPTRKEQIKKILEEKGWEHIPGIDQTGAYLDKEFFKQGKGDN